MMMNALKVIEHTMSDKEPIKEETKQPKYSSPSTASSAPTKKQSVYSSFEVKLAKNIVKEAESSLQEIILFANSKELQDKFLDFKMALNDFCEEMTDTDISVNQNIGEDKTKGWLMEEIMKGYDD